MLVLRAMVILLGAALLICVYFLISRREDKIEKQKKEARISAIYHNMYVSGWINQMMADIEAGRARVTTATVTSGGVDIPGVYSYAIDAGTTRLFDADEIFVISYIIYATLNDEGYLPPRAEADGSMTIRLRPPPLNEPY